MFKGKKKTESNVGLVFRLAWFLTALQRARHIKAHTYSVKVTEGQHTKTFFLVGCMLFGV